MKSQSHIRQSVRVLAGYTPGEQMNDPQVIKLNTNENPYPPSPDVLTVLSRVTTAELQKYPDPVCTEIREVLAQLHGCAADEVFVGNGSDEVLALCTRAFVENDGAVGYFEPSYSLYPVLAQIRDARLMPVAFGADFSWREPDADGAGLFFLANPNAPTGTRFPADVLRGFCARFDGVVVIDEAYVDFADGDAMALAVACPNVLVARTLSKSYSLAGVRLGYVVGHRELIGAMNRIKDSYNVNVLTQQVALAALRDRAHMLANVERIKDTRVRLRVALQARGFEVCPSETNFLWARPTAIEARVLYERLRAKRILIRYFDNEGIRENVRITVGTDDEVTALIAAIDECLAG